MTGRIPTLQDVNQKPGKPHPAKLQRAMAEVGAGSDPTMIVSDTVFAVARARAAGATAVGVGWGVQAGPRLREAGAVAVLSEFDELFDVLWIIV